MTREQWEKLIDLLACGDTDNMHAYKRWYYMRCDLWAHNQIEVLIKWDQLRHDTRGAIWKRRLR